MHQCTIAHSGKTQGDDNTPISCKISLPMLLLTGRMIEKTHFSFITTFYAHRMGLLYVMDNELCLVLALTRTSPKLYTLQLQLIYI